MSDTTVPVRYCDQCGYSLGPQVFHLDGKEYHAGCVPIAARPMPPPPDPIKFEYVEAAIAAEMPRSTYTLAELALMPPQSAKGGSVGKPMVPRFWVHAKNAHELNAGDVTPDGCVDIVDGRSFDILAHRATELEAIVEAAKAMRAQSTCHIYVHTGACERLDGEQCNSCAAARAFDAAVSVVRDVHTIKLAGDEAVAAAVDKYRRAVEAAKARRELDYDIEDLCACDEPDCAEWKIREAIRTFDAAVKEIGGGGE